MITIHIRDGDLSLKNLVVENRLGIGRLRSDCKVDEGDLSKLGLSLTLVEIQHNDGVSRIFVVWIGPTGHAGLKLGNQILIFVFA